MGAADLGCARQESEHRAGIGTQCGRDRLGHLPLHRRVDLAADIAGLDRKGAALALDHGRIAEQLCDPRAVERCRHHEDAQVLAQAGLRVARQRKAKIGIERTLVEFVEQHGGNAVELGIVEDLPREDALGDDLDPRRPRHLGAEAHPIADGLSGPLTKRLGHPLGTGACSDAARLQHDDLFAFGPRRVEQRQRHARGLAGAGRRDQHGGVVAIERAVELVEHGVDRQRAIELVRQGVSSRRRSAGLASCG